MSSTLHICNTFFEKELETSAERPLADWMRSHPVVMQLQFLPLLYSAPQDSILVSDLPPNPAPRLCLAPPPRVTRIEHWGPSRAIAAWAAAHYIPYPIPNWELICKINSKVFSFTESPRLPGAELLQTEAEIASWITKTPDPKVLKTPFGTAGQGHIKNPKISDVKRLYIAPLIGEPWVERVQDFSTQWKNGELVGITVFENEPNGTYKGTYAGQVEPWALKEHLAVAQPLVEKIKHLGYSDHLGIDSYIYLWEGKKRVQPIVEINARKTMSWVALQMPQKHLYYTREKEGLLPSQLTVRGKTIRFARNIS